MALDQNFKHLDIREALENTHMRGRNITFLDDFSRNEIHSLFQAAKMLELAEDVIHLKDDSREIRLNRSCEPVRIF